MNILIKKENMKVMKILEKKRNQLLKVKITLIKIIIILVKKKKKYWIIKKILFI